MAESFVYSLAPELKGIDPQRVWDSEVTKGYPASLYFGDAFWYLAGLATTHAALGEYLNELQLIPESGAILELGAGPCSELVFGRQVVRDRVWGVDYAESQLARSQIREKRQVVADLRKDDFVTKLEGNRFVLASSLLLAKYLTSREARSLYERIRSIAQRLVVVECQSVAEEFAELLGQKRTFVLEAEKMLLEQAGWKEVTRRILEVKVGGDSHFLGLVWGENRVE